jgi:hypothetical protein
MRINLWVGCVLLCHFNLLGLAATNEPAPPTEGFSASALFEKGRFEGGLNSGVLFSPFVATYQRPTINYTFTGIQFGYMLSDVKGSGFFRGNFELAGEGFGCAIFDGPGSFIAGITVWGRYNFVPVKSRFVPFVQAGLGLTSTDIDREIVGQPFNFNLDLGVGTRYFVSQKWALTLEYRFQHISNANSAEHNIGINANGPLLGVTYLF